jgi:hypothetical protein
MAIAIVCPEIGEYVNGHRRAFLRFTDSNPAHTLWTVSYSQNSEPFVVVSAGVTTKDYTWPWPLWFRGSIEIKVQHIASGDTSSVTVSAITQGKYRLAWLNPAESATLAFEEWDAMNTEYIPFDQAPSRVQRLDGLSVILNSAPPTPKLGEISLKGEGMTASTFERILARYTGIDSAQTWNSLPIYLSDEYGNEITVRLSSLVPTPVAGSGKMGYEMRFFVSSVHDLGYVDKIFMAYR